MDGPFYKDTKPPFLVTSGSTITLLTTNQALLPAALLPLFGPNYFNYDGKAVKIRVYGQCSSFVTPGNFSIGLYYGTGANNTGTLITGVNFPWTASQANTSFQSEFFVRCRGLGASGSLLGWGWVFVQVTGIAMMPPSAPAPVTVDLTQAFTLSVQCLRTGSTAETVQLHDILYEAMN